MPKLLYTWSADEGVRNSSTPSDPVENFLRCRLAQSGEQSGHPVALVPTRLRASPVASPTSCDGLTHCSDVRSKFVLAERPLLTSGATLLHQNVASDG